MKYCVWNLASGVSLCNREREKERQRERETERQRETETEKERDREPQRATGTDRVAGRWACCHTSEPVIGGEGVGPAGVETRGW